MEELRRDLFKLINSVTNLPPEAIYYVCKDVFREVQDSYNMYLKNKEFAAKADAQPVQEAPTEETAEKED